MTRTAKTRSEKRPHHPAVKQRSSARRGLMCRRFPNLRVLAGKKVFRKLRGKTHPCPFFHAPPLQPVDFTFFTSVFAHQHAFFQLSTPSHLRPSASIRGSSQWLSARCPVLPQPTFLSQPVDLTFLTFVTPIQHASNQSTSKSTCDRSSLIDHSCPQTPYFSGESTFDRFFNSIQRTPNPPRPPLAVSLVVPGANSMTFPAVLFGAGCVAHSLQTTAGMLVARSLPAPKIPCRYRHRIYAWDH